MLTKRFKHFDGDGTWKSVEPEQLILKLTEQNIEFLNTQSFISEVIHSASHISQLFIS